MASDEYTFTPFTKHAFYSSLTNRFLDMVALGPDQRIIDLACGSGSVTKHLTQRLKHACDSVIIAIDHSATALREAMDNLKDVRDSAVQYMQSHVGHLSEAVKEPVDMILYCNAIHYIQDKDELLAEVSKILKPGGTFAFNTSFFEGGNPPESLLFYRRWMMKALRNLRREHGLKPIKEEKVESRVHLTADSYRDLLERNGFKVVRQEVDKVDVPIEGWLDISRFEDFIQGVMPGVPLDQASASMVKAVRDTFEELNLTYVPRNWLDMVAIRV